MNAKTERFNNHTHSITKVLFSSTSSFNFPHVIVRCLAAVIVIARSPVKSQAMCMCISLILSWILSTTIITGGGTFL